MRNWDSHEWRDRTERVLSQNPETTANAGDRTANPVSDHTAHFTGQTPCDSAGAPLHKILHSSPGNEIAPGTPWLAALNARGETYGPTRWMTVYNGVEGDPFFAGTLNGAARIYLFHLPEPPPPE